MTKQQREVWVEWYLDCKTVGQVFDELVDIIKEHGRGIRVDVSSDDDGAVISYITKREETDEEYEARLRREALLQAQAVARELQQLKALQAKYPHAK